jgi:hypothetical protein
MRSILIHVCNYCLILPDSKQKVAKMRVFVWRACLFVRSNSKTAEYILIKFYIGGFDWNLLRHFHFSLNRTTIMGTSHENLHAFLLVPLMELSTFISEPKIFRTKLVEKDETHILWPVQCWRQLNKRKRIRRKCYFILTFSHLLNSCLIWGSHSGGYEDYHLLGYNAM